MPNEAAPPEKRSDKAWGFLLGWIGRITAIVGFCATVAGGVTWTITHHRQHQARTAQLSLAKTQADQGEYQASIETYAAMLKSDSQDHEALDDQLNTTMLWAENFSVLIPEGQSAAEIAGHALDQMMSILESGLTRSEGRRAADVQSHLGWAHWLNQHIAEREFGSAAEKNFRMALASDPANIYANAMLGNWMLQNGGDFSEAVQHFRAATHPGVVLPFVRRLELGGLISDDRPGSRHELFTVADSMRAHDELLDPGERRRIFGFCCDIGVTDRTELLESLSAVSARNAWLTYQWLEGSGSDNSPLVLQAMTHDYIQATLLEISGQRSEALRQYRTLQQKLRAQPRTALRDAVDAAAGKLSHS